MWMAAALAVGGCDLLLDNPAPEEARLAVQGEAGKPIRVITSTEFVAGVDELGVTRVELFVADTVVTTLPYRQTYRIDRGQRYFVEASRLGTDLQTIQVQVWVDDRKQFDRGGTLIDGSPYRFVYTFNQVVTRDIIVL
jgi:hypothetical protein